MKIKFYLFFLIFFFLILYNSLVFFSINDKKKYSKFLIKKKEHVYFYEKFSQKNHHLRDPPKGDLFDEKESHRFYFTEINKFEDKKINILLQGDSWIDSIDNIPESSEKVKSFAKRNNIGLINAGVSSYSPSAFNAQFEILEKEFNIKPDIVLVYIDQTDIGDENCRYKDRKIENSYFLKAEFHSNRVYDFTKLLAYSRINAETENTLLNVLKTNNFYIKSLFYSFFLKEKESCTYNSILSYLREPNEKDIKYFKEVTKKYIEYLIEKKYIKKIIVVTHPHYENLTNEYKFNMGNFINNLEFKNNKVVHLNFENLILRSVEKNKFRNIYKKDDTTHLNNQAHSISFIPIMLEFLNFEKNKIKK